ncbi:MAG: phosphoserine phosphatase, partial [Thermoplasmata archaeon]|nr:phosphoserine phosphatase [Thermoplasmata archaeon]
HREVNRLADEAQRYHEKMSELFSKADEKRKEADKAQEKFVETKKRADEEHKLHIELIHQVHDLDKILYGIKKKRRGKRPKEELDLKAQAQKIYEKFKAGEKLSTEDLMILQKAGLI